MSPSDIIVGHHRRTSSAASISEAHRARSNRMALTLKPGTRLFSVVCTTEMIVVKASGADVQLTIGGAQPVTSASERTEVGEVADGHGGGSAIGKRYVDAEQSVEVLVTKPGDGVPAIAGELLTIKDAKPLPASD